MNETLDNAPYDEAEQAQLVAYLDGELDAEESRQVEQRLADDERFRLQLKELDEAWGLLEDLPRAEADDVFTRTTVAMVAVAAKEDVRRGERREQTFWLVLTVVVGAALTFGFYTSRFLTDQPHRQLTADLPVITNVDIYRYTESVEWLELLDKSELFVDDEELNDAL